jgi:L,D-transpeptidase YcbB
MNALIGDGLRALTGMALAFAASLAPLRAAPLADAVALVSPEASLFERPSSLAPLIALADAQRQGARGLPAFLGAPLDFAPVGEIAAAARGQGALSPSAQSVQAAPVGVPGPQPFAAAPPEDFGAPSLRDAAPSATPAPAQPSAPGTSHFDNGGNASAPSPGPAAPSVAPAPPPAEADLSPAESALKAALDRLAAAPDRPDPLGAGDWRAARAAIAAFYGSRHYDPIWTGSEGLTLAGRAVVAQAARAGDDGLDLGRFAPPRDVTGLGDDALAETEIQIAAAVVAYAEQASGSRTPTARFSPLVSLKSNIADPGQALAEVAAAPDPAQRLAAFNPPQKGYRDLREALARLNGGSEGVAGLRRPGTAAVASIDVDAGQVRADIDLLAGAQGAAAGRRGRRRPTLASAGEGALLPKRRAAVLANMEMWRWEPRDMGERRVEVNLPDFSIVVYDSDSEIFRTRAVVGKAETPTPIFSNVMRYVLINPAWEVPDSIIKKEMASKLGYLSRRGYEVKTVDGRLVVRQLPGERNALGRLAFMFPNDHSVYLHDTPERQLFDEEARAFSHGCVRVEDPLSLAEIVLGEKWPAERIEAAYGNQERTVMLPEPLPIHIEYFTEFIDEAGELEERQDVYGLTRRVEGMIATASQD